MPPATNSSSRGELAESFHFVSGNEEGEEARGVQNESRTPHNDHFLMRRGQAPLWTLLSMRSGWSWEGIYPTARLTGTRRDEPWACHE